ncbi:MAG: energy transducer TonB [Spirosomataceae bacterium]
MRRFNTLFMLIISLYTSFLYAQSAAQPTEENPKIPADKFYKKGQYELAKASYEKAKQLPGQEADDYLIDQLANCDRCLGLLKALEQTAKDADSLKMAIVIYEKILDINPSDSIIRHKLVENSWHTARQRYRELDFRKAAELFKKAADYPDSPFIQEARMLMDSSTIFQESMVAGFIAPHVDSIATFNTGLKGIASIISSNMKYPEKAVAQKISGKVWVSLVVNEKGKIIPDMVKIAKGIGGGCDEEAVRLVKMMSHWHPAYKWGKPVRFQTTVPITFVLSH